MPPPVCPPVAENIMSQPDLVIFDCDGVLVDSEIIAARVEAELITAAVYAITPQELAETCTNLTFTYIHIAIEEKASIPFQASMSEQAEALIDQRLPRDVRAIEGAVDAFVALATPRRII